MKTTLTFIRRAAILLLLSTLNPQLSTFALGTAFTYQGRLNDNSGPANGTYDITFALFAAINGGVAIAGPVTNTATAVSNGLFTATIDFGGGAFDGTARWLEIGVRTNTGGAFTTLAPRQPLTPAPYAVFAGGASAAGLTGTIPAGNIANGSITANQLAAGAVVSNLNASGQAGVASGGTILSASNNNSALLTAGYVKLGVIQSGDIWQPLTGGTPPSVRYGHTAVWTGGEMIVWGGFNGAPLNDGGRFNPAGNGGLGGWTSLASATGPSPAARFEHTAVWTGTEMIVWGGGGATILSDGGRYNPTANSWTTVTTTAAPAARANHTAIWTGTEMIVWGGNSNTTYYADGGRFNPAGNGGLGTWTSLASATGTPPAARANHTAVWTGTDMIIWGGGNGTTFFGDGFRYNPASNSWTAVANTGPLAGRRAHTALWTGSEMLIWGGAASTSIFNDGARYNPATNGWTSITTFGAPVARYYHTAVWTGVEMIVWGGEGSSGYLNDGGRYNPTTSGWSPVSTNSNPTTRALHTAVWTGGEMIVWGGFNGTTFNDTWSYSPGSVMFLYQKP